MPAVASHHRDQVGARFRARRELNIPCIALFPYTEAPCANDHGCRALHPDNLSAVGARDQKDFPISQLATWRWIPSHHGHTGVSRTADSERRDGRGAGCGGAVLARGPALRYRASAMMTPRRRYPHARTCRPSRRPDHGLCRQILLFLYGPSAIPSARPKTLTADNRTYKNGQRHSDERCARSNSPIAAGAEW